MNGTIRTGSMATAAAALTIVGLAVAPARAQIVTGVPTGRAYDPGDNFAENWYDPGDWYNRFGGGPGYGAAADVGGMEPELGVDGDIYEGPGGLGVEGDIYEGPGTFGELGERGEADYEAPPSRPTPYRGAPYFQRGYSPYSGYRDFDDDFYDDDYSGGYGLESADEPGEALDETAAALGAETVDDEQGAPIADELNPAATDERGAPVADELNPAATDERGAPVADGAGAVPAGPSRAIEEHDELFEDYDSLYGGYGDTEYVERGYRPRANYGVGPRLRNYYSEGWFDDGADFDDWYDNMENFGEGLTQPEGLEDQGDVEGELEDAADAEAINALPEPG